jgi:hypothetical protein
LNWNVTASVLDCRVAKKLFDGRKWAKYEVHRTAGADEAGNCKLVVLHSRSVQIENTRESSLEGIGLTLTDMLDPQARMTCVCTASDRSTT